MDRSAAIASTRFGLGPRPGELASYGDDPVPRLLAQLDAPAPHVEAPSTVDTLREVIRTRRAGLPLEEEQRLRRRERDRLQAELGRRAVARVASRAPFQERWLSFWSNHFTVSISNPRVIGFALSYEREAIRPLLSRRFSDMLRAVVQHPAMLLYLDNQRSIGPDSRVGRRRELGLNENLAREILELHTLGVDGGYDQADVLALAGLLTGWSVASDTEDVDDRGTEHGFFFRPQAHQPGGATLLGRRFGEGRDAGEAALEHLARQPATARHIARKLAVHFIADQPPAAAVDRLAAVFEDRRGDLPALAEAVLQSEEAWASAGSKLRGPEDWLTAAARALAMDELAARGDGRERLAEGLVGGLRALGALPYSAPSPAGWPDTAPELAGAEALLGRVTLAERLGALTAAVYADPVAHAQALLGPLLSERTRLGISRAPDRGQALALLLSSPELMRR